MKDDSKAVKKINEELLDLVLTVKGEFYSFVHSKPEEIDWAPRHRQASYFDHPHEENFSLLIQSLSQAFGEAKTSPEMINETQIKYLLAILSNMMKSYRQHSKKPKESVIDIQNRCVSLGNSLLPFIHKEYLKTDLNIEINYSSCMLFLHFKDINLPAFYLALDKVISLNSEVLGFQIYEFTCIQQLSGACCQTIKENKVEDLKKLTQSLFSLSEKVYKYIDSIIFTHKNATPQDQKLRFCFQYLIYFIKLLLTLPRQDDSYFEKLMPRIHFILKIYNKTILPENICLATTKLLMSLLEGNFNILPQKVRQSFLEISANFIPDITQDPEFKKVKQAREELIKSINPSNAHLDIFQSVLQLIPEIKNSIISHEMKHSPENAQAACVSMELNPIVNYLMEVLENFSKKELSQKDILLEEKLLKILDKSFQLPSCDSNFIIPQMRIISHKVLQYFKRAAFDDEKIPFLIDEFKRLNITRTEHMFWKIQCFKLVITESLEFMQSREKNISPEKYNLILKNNLFYMVEIIGNLSSLKELKEVNQRKLHGKLMLEAVKVVFNLSLTVRYHNVKELTQNLSLILTPLKELLNHFPFTNIDEAFIIKIINNMTEYVRTESLINHSWVISHFVEIMQKVSSFYKSEEIKKSQAILSSFATPSNQNLEGFSESLISKLIAHCQSLQSYLQTPEFNQSKELILKKTTNELMSFILKAHSLFFRDPSKKEKEIQLSEKGFDLIDTFYIFFGQPQEFLSLILQAKSQQIIFKMANESKASEIITIVNQISGCDAENTLQRYEKLKHSSDSLDFLQYHTVQLIDEQDESVPALFTTLMELSSDIINLCQTLMIDFLQSKPINENQLLSGALCLCLNAIVITFNHFPFEKENLFIPPIEKLLLKIKQFIQNNPILENNPESIRPMISPDEERLGRYNFFKIYDELAAKFSPFSPKPPQILDSKPKTEDSSCKQKKIEIEQALCQKNKEISELKSQIKNLQELKQNHLSSYKDEELKLQKLKRNLEKSQDLLKLKEQKNEESINSLAEKQKIEITELERNHQSSLQRETDSFEKTCHNLRIALENIRQEINVTEKNLTEQTLKVQEKNVELKHQTNEIQKVKQEQEEKLKKNQLEMATADNNIAHMENEISQIREQLNQKQEMNDQQELEFKQLSQELRAVKADYQNEKQKVTQSAPELKAEIKLFIDYAQARKKYQDKQIDKLHNELTSIQTNSISSNLTTWPRFTYSNPQYQPETIVNSAQLVYLPVYFTQT